MRKHYIVDRLAAAAPDAIPATVLLREIQGRGRPAIISPHALLGSVAGERCRSTSGQPTVSPDGSLSLTLTLPPPARQTFDDIVARQNPLEQLPLGRRLTDIAGVT